MKRDFEKHAQLFTDGSLLILMRNVEDMKIRKMTRVAQIPETESHAQIVDGFTKKFKCALTNHELDQLKSLSGRSSASAFAHIDPNSQETRDYMTNFTEYLKDHGRAADSAKYACAR